MIAYMGTYIHSGIRICIHTLVHAHVRTCTSRHLYVYAYVQIHLHAYAIVHTQTMHKYPHIHIDPGLRLFTAQPSLSCRIMLGLLVARGRRNAQSVNICQTLTRHTCLPQCNNTMIQVRQHTASCKKTPPLPPPHRGARPGPSRGLVRVPRRGSYRSRCASAGGGRRFFWLSLKRVGRLGMPEGSR